MFDEGMRLAVNRRSRLKGLLFTKPHKELLLLCPCNSIHTVGMRHALDVAFVDERGLVVDSFCKVGRSTFLRNRKAKIVLERFACNKPWFVKGEKITIGDYDASKKGRLL